jgi:DNA topoisomerase IA
MTLLRTLVSVGVVSVVATTAVVTSPQSASAYHKTNKWEVRSNLEKDGWTVLYSQELSHTEEAKLAIALASDATVSSGGATTAFFASFAESSLQQIASEAKKKAPQIAQTLIKELTVKKILSAIRTSFNGRQVELSAAGIKLQAGRATYNRAECLKVFGREKCTSTPNTYQPYIRFKVK